jgi:hypothetical protein
MVIYNVTSPSSNAKKSTTISWLNEKRIAHIEDILKPEVYKLIKERLSPCIAPLR